MSTLNVEISDLKILLDEFDGFVSEDRYSSDYCRFCLKQYGNVQIMKERGEAITHQDGCPYIIAEKIKQRLTSENAP